jgi:hypothetical protein
VLNPDLLRCIAEMQACTEPCLGAAIGWKDWAIEAMIICEQAQQKEEERS